jgi:hypothetical protein
VEGPTGSDVIEAGSGLLSSMPLPPPPSWPRWQFRPTTLKTALRLQHAVIWFAQPQPKSCQRYCGAGLPDGLFSNQKSQILINFGGPFNSKCWYISSPFEIFYGYLL